MKITLTGIGLPQFHPAKLSWPNESWRWAYGVHDPPGRFDENLQPSPLLYKSWDIKPDAITIQLREGIQWQKGYGEMTADDVVFSWNEAMRSDSSYVDAPQHRLTFDSLVAIDKYTVKVPVKSASLLYLWPKWLDAASPSVINVFSKKYLTEQGENPPLDLGTGPFVMESFATGDRVVLTAVPNHWRQTSHVAKVTAFQVAEPATRIAQIKTGEVDIAEIPLANVDELTGAGSKLKANQMQLAGVFCTLTPTGQYYTKTNPYSNNAPISSIITRKKAEGGTVFADWLKAHPWVGDPDDPASMEKARKVRWAMALAIDKESVVRNVMAGHGNTNFARRIIRQSEPLWLEPGTHEKWAAQMPPKGDLARAKQLLTEAGYPNGFSADLLITVGARAEIEGVAQAIVPMLEAAGIRVTISRIEIQASQARGADYSWQELNVSCGSLEPWPLFQQNSVMQSASIQIPEFDDFVREAASAGGNLELLRPITQKYAEIQFHQQYDIGLVQGDRIFVSGPRVASWSIIPGPGGHPNSFETVVLAK